jgi:hypothetical protein
MEQSRFVNVAVSDGSFGPRHAFFTTTFDNQTNGRPRGFIPFAGFAYDDPTQPITHAKGWTFQGRDDYTLEGVGGRSVAAIYPLAVAVGNGMLVQASSGPGLDVYVQAEEGAVAPDYAAIERGHREYRDKGYRLLHGNFGWGYVDVPLPWGESADMDAFLRAAGHAPDVVDPPPPPPVVLTVPATADLGSAWVGHPTAGEAQLTNPSSVAVDWSATVDGGEFAVTPHIGSVPAGGTVALLLTCTPTAAGARSATLTVESNASNSPHVVALTATGVAPTLEMRVADLERRLKNAGIPE